MNPQYGNMFEEIPIHTDVLLVTTNSYIRADGALVMGRGAAASAKTHWPWLPYSLGKRIEHLGEYNIGIIASPEGDFVGIGAFQVKYHFKDQASLELIEHSTKMLSGMALARPELQFHLNYPGIGNGYLLKRHVQPIIEELPDNVNVWQFNKGEQHA